MHMYFLSVNIELCKLSVYSPKNIEVGGLHSISGFSAHWLCDSE